MLTAAFPCYPTQLSDREGALLAPVLPPAKPCGRPRSVDLRLILDGLFPVLRSGGQWRLLPHAYGPWSTVYASLRLAQGWDLGAGAHRPARAGAAGGRAPPHAPRRQQRASNRSGPPRAVVPTAPMEPSSCRGAHDSCSSRPAAWCTACGRSRWPGKTARGPPAPSGAEGVPAPPGADLG
jgi:putative transposase